MGEENIIMTELTQSGKELIGQLATEKPPAGTHRLAIDREKDVLVFVISQTYRSADQVMVGGKTVAEWEGNENYPSDDPVIDTILLASMDPTNQAGKTQAEFKENVYTYPVSRLQPLMSNVDWARTPGLDGPSDDRDGTEWDSSLSSPPDDGTLGVEDLRRFVVSFLSCPPEEVVVYETEFEVTVAVARVAMVDAATSEEELRERLIDEFSPLSSRVDLSISVKDRDRVVGKP